MTRGGQIGQTNGVKPWRTFEVFCAISTVCVAPADAAPDPAVRVDPAAKTLLYAGGSAAIPLLTVAKENVSITEVPLDDGKIVMHVKVRSEPNPWEAIVAHDKLVFSGFTGFAKGEPGERTGEAVRVLGRDVMVADIQEDRKICGQEFTALSPRVLDPKTMELRGATVQRLPTDQRQAARRIIASARGGPAEPALSRLLVARGASTGTAKSLTDGDIATVWTEQRPGMGQGEFVTMDAPYEVGLSGFSITVAPLAPGPAGAAPQAFFLVTDSQTFAITMPDDAWTRPGEAYDIPLPEPIHTTCISLVLNSAYVRGTAPEVSLAELVAYSSFDGPAATLDKVAAALGGGGPRAEGAAAVLKRAPGGLAAVSAAYAQLDAAGRALAMDVASVADCEKGAPLLVGALGETDREVVRKARGKLERCGKAAANALSEGALTGSPRVRLEAPMLLAQVAPREALAPLAEAMTTTDEKARAAARKALAHAARDAEKSALAALLAKRGSQDARIDMLRALAARLFDVRADANAVFPELLAPGAPMRTRYLLAAPIAELARAGDLDAAARLVAFISRDSDVPVRAHAAELAAGIAAAEAALAAAVEDPEPRVREAALRSIALAHLKSGEAHAIKRIGEDPWTFVRMAAAGAIAALPASAASDRALAGALKDPSPRVRASAILALAAHRATGQAEALLERLDDGEEDLEVRIAAARALGQICARMATNRLVKLAASGASPVASEDERAVGMAAIDALGRLHPPDLAARLAKARAPDANAGARRAAEHALRETDVCR